MTTPKAISLANHEIVTLAVYLLGGDTQRVDTEVAYEVAFSEYAIALAQELAKRDEYRDPTDPIFDIRETLNRVARKGANLYAQ